jgi:phosphoenolpyruvate carboxykinase (GTP)
MASERTAAAEGVLGELRRDPFAMWPFTGYNVGEHWAHWLSIGERLRISGRFPRIFHVNWFRRGDAGELLWPGFGDNVRVVKWMMDRLRGDISGVDSPVGTLPHPTDVDLSGLELSASAANAILTVDAAEIEADARDVQSLLTLVGSTVPPEVWAENAETIKKCGR